MPQIRKVALDIQGMHCNSCASGIQLVLQSTDGVLSASTSYDAKRGEVEYDEEKIKLEDILKAIDQLGYKATIKQ